MIKSYTDIKQSQILAEILPIESADMTHRWFGKALNVDCYEVSYGRDTINGKDIPCWSLAALINILGSKADHVNIGGTEGYWWCRSLFSDISDIPKYTGSDNLVDVCVNMIIKLKEMNLI